MNYADKPHFGSSLHGWMEGVSSSSSSAIKLNASQSAHDLTALAVVLL